MSRIAGVSLITGASSGIGAALARELAGQGSDLVLLARREERLQDLAGEIRAMGRRAIAVRGDVTRDGDLERAVQQAHEELGTIDLVVANAGFAIANQVAKLTLEDFQRQFETNVNGVLRTVYATMADLRASRGCLALVGSVNGYVALPGAAPYCMSKFAVRALAASLRFELAGTGVGVVHIAPGFVASEIRQVDRQGVYHAEAADSVPGWLVVPADVAAREMARGIRRRRQEVVVTGHGKLLVFLQRHFPGLLAVVVRRFIGTRTYKKP